LKGLPYSPWKELSKVVLNVPIETSLTFKNDKNMKFGNLF
jgi:hypothetical protein